MTNELRRTGVSTIALAIALLLAPPVRGQKPDDEGEWQKTDLGDGLWLVERDGEMHSLYDTRAGLSFQMVDDRPALIDKKAGAMLLGGPGDPELIDLRPESKGRPLDDPELAERMKGKLDLLQFTLRQKMENRRKQGLTDRDEEPPAARQATDRSTSLGKRAAGYQALLGANDEEFGLVVLPLLLAVLEKQDEIQRSTLDPTRSHRRAREKLARSPDLPEAIRALHELFLAETVEADRWTSALEAFRTARRDQDRELKIRRDRLREVLTVAQESVLAAAGILD